MGDLYYPLKRGEETPVEPVGTLATDGWLPGTWVTYAGIDATFSGAILTVDLSDGTGLLAGFLVTAPQHNQPVMLQSDMWTTDTRQRAGGSTKQDWGPFDASARFQFDSDSQLQRIGTRTVTMVIPPSGMHKFYAFEIYNLAERTTPGSGASLSYTPGDIMYVSNRGLFTNEKESLSSKWTGYMCAKYGTDGEGDYIITIAGMGFIE
jgi:hypothetical protein